MEVSTIIELATILITLILGVVAKKVFFVKTNFIPLQNLLIGIISFTIYYITTRDINTALVFSGLLAGGIYDLAKNLGDIHRNERELELQELEYIEEGKEDDI